MKKIVFILILVNTCFISFSTAQEAEPKPGENAKSRFYVGLNFAPSSIHSPSYRYYYYSAPGSGGNVLFAGIHAGYNYKNIFNLQLGFEYSNETVHSPESIFARFPAVSNTGNYFKAVYNVNYIQLPLTCNIYLSGSKNKLQLYLSFGVIYRYQLSKEKLTEFTSEDQVFREDKTTIAEHNWLVSFGVGAQYKLSNNFCIYADPAYRLRLCRNLSSNGWPKLNGAELGLNIGINYNF